MDNFHLNLHNETTTAWDEDGIEFIDIGAARDAALAGIRDFISHEAKTGKIDLRGRIDIADDTGKILETVRFEEAFAQFGTSSHDYA